MYSKFSILPACSFKWKMRLWFVTNPGIVGRVVLLALILGSQNLDLRLKKTSPQTVVRKKKKLETEVYINILYKYYV